MYRQQYGNFVGAGGPTDLNEAKVPVSTTIEALIGLAKTKGLGDERATDVAWMAHRFLFPTSARHTPLYKVYPRDGVDESTRPSAHALGLNIYTQKPYLDALDKADKVESSRARNNDLLVRRAVDEGEPSKHRNGSIKDLLGIWLTTTRVVPRLANALLPMLRSDNSMARLRGNAYLVGLCNPQSWTAKETVCQGFLSSGFGNNCSKHEIKRGVSELKLDEQADLAVRIINGLTPDQLRRLDRSTAAHLAFALQRSSFRAFDVAGSEIAVVRDIRYDALMIAGDEIMWQGSDKPASLNPEYRAALQRLVQNSPRGLSYRPWPDAPGTVHIVSENAFD